MKQMLNFSSFKIDALSIKSFSWDLDSNGRNQLKNFEKVFLGLDTSKASSSTSATPMWTLIPTFASTTQPSSPTSSTCLRSASRSPSLTSSSQVRSQFQITKDVDRLEWPDLQQAHIGHWQRQEPAEGHQGHMLLAIRQKCNGSSLNYILLNF